MKSFDFYSFNDYRDLLREWFYQAKETQPKMSFRFVGRQLGLRSPNHFQLVITRKRHFSSQALIRMMKLLQPSSRERQFLMLLFRKDTEKNQEKAQEVLVQLEQMRRATAQADLSEEKYELVGNSLAWFIKMGAIAFEGRTYDEAKRHAINCCPFSLEDKAVDQAFETLQELGLLQIVDSRCRFEFGNITTKWDFDRAEIKTHHLNNLNLGIEAIPMEIDQRFFSSVTIPCDQALYDQTIQQIRSLAQKVLEESNRKILVQDQCEKLVTLHFSLVPYFQFDPKSNNA